MALQKGTLNGVPIVEDSASTGTPVTDVTGDGGDVIAGVAAHVARARSSIVVDTVADLASVTPLIDGQTYQTLRYSSSHTVGDGSGNLYRYVASDATTADGGFIITHASGRFHAVDKSVANVMQFGAVGNGVTDDTTAIQAAIDTGVDVILAGVAVCVAGALTPNATTNTIDLRNGKLANLSGEVSGIVFEDSASNYSVRLENVTFDGYEIAVFQKSTHTGNLSFHATNCVVQNCDRGFFLSECFDEVNISNCHFKDIVKSTANSVAAIAVGDIAADSGKADSAFGACVISSCIFSNIDGGTGDETHAIWAERGKITIANCLIDGVDKDTAGNGAEAIYLASHLQAVVTGNVILNGGSGQGAICSKTGNATIVGNTIRADGTAQASLGIYAEGSNTVIANNVIDGIEYVNSSAVETQGIGISIGPGGTATNVLCKSNIIKNHNGRYGIYSRAIGPNIQITGNSIAGPGHASAAQLNGIYVQPPTSGDMVAIAIDENYVELPLEPNCTGVINGISVTRNTASNRNHSSISVSNNQINVANVVGQTARALLFDIVDDGDTAENVRIENNVNLGTESTCLVVLVRSGTTWDRLVVRGNDFDINDITETTASPILMPGGSSLIDSSSNAVNATLPDGDYVGQTKTIVMTDATNSSTVTVTNHETSADEVFTFDAVDEHLAVQWIGTEWVTLKATATT